MRVNILYLSEEELVGHFTLDFERRYPEYS